MSVSPLVLDSVSLFIDTNLTTCDKRIADELMAYISSNVHEILDCMGIDFVQERDIKVVNNLQSANNYKSIQVHMQIVPDDILTVLQIQQFANEFFRKHLKTEDMVLGIRAMHVHGSAVKVYELL